MAENDETSARRQQIDSHCTRQNLSQGTLQNGCLGWFLEEKYRYPVRHGNKLHVYDCGAAVFSDIAESISKAKQSVDMVMWGFDPAMPIVRDKAHYSKDVPPLLAAGRPSTYYSVWRKQDAFGERIFMALRDNPRLKIRMVIWYNPVSHSFINNIVGIDSFQSQESAPLDRSSIGFEPKALGDAEALRRLQLFRRTPEATAYSLYWFQTVRWRNFSERDRLAVVFRNIANTEVVGAALNSQDSGFIARLWSNIQQTAADLKKSILSTVDDFNAWVQSTDVYKQYAEIRDRALNVLAQIQTLASEKIADISRRIQEVPLVRQTIDQITALKKDITQTLDELEKNVLAIVADYLSENPPINYIEQLRKSRIELLQSLADILEVKEEDVNFLSNYSERATLLFATDHQKTILVDYEDDTNRHGYVMGHNSTTSYWSRFPFVHRDPLNEMSYTPFHDFSMHVKGPVLIDLNHNFCEAWDKKRVSGIFDLTEDNIPFPEPGSHPAQASRSVRRSALEERGATTLADERKQYEQSILSQTAQGSARAQIVRTRPDERFSDDFQEKEVKDAYLQATRHASNYIFIVNQYCQYPALIRHIKYWRRQRLMPDDQSKLYILMGTCKPEQDGQVYTAQQMANELGVGAQFTVANDELYDKDRIYDDDGHRHKTWRGAWADAAPHVVAKDLKELQIEVLFFMFYTQIPEVPAGQAAEPPARTPRLGEVEREAFANAKKAIANSIRYPNGVPAKAQESEEPKRLPPERIAQQPYVHAKLMIQDDTFLTLGSSNLNVRSMAIDSELNLITDDFDTAQKLRFHLFNTYTQENFSEDKFPNREYGYAQGVDARQMQDDLEAVFSRMTEIALDNANRVKEGNRIQGYIARFADDRSALGMRVS